jgi:hypothetical protein
VLIRFDGIISRGPGQATARSFFAYTLAPGSLLQAFERYYRGSALVQRPHTLSAAELENLLADRAARKSLQKLNARVLRQVAVRLHPEAARAPWSGPTKPKLDFCQRARGCRARAKVT